MFLIALFLYIFILFGSVSGTNKLAKIKYLPNNFEIIEDGDHVICAISQKKILIENLNYWNVDLQEAYYSYKEASMKKDKA